MGIILPVPPTDYSNFERDFYVYRHRKITDKSIYYVGKGREYRAWSTAGRNRAWMDTFRNEGRIVEIVAYDLREPDAYRLEAELIELSRQNGDPLVNNARGMKLNVRADVDYCWEHKSGLLVRGTPSELMSAYGGREVGWAQLLNGYAERFKGWRCVPGNPHLYYHRPGTPIPKTAKEINRVRMSQERYL